MLGFRSFYLIEEILAINVWAVETYSEEQVVIKICALCFSLVLILDSSLLYQVNALYKRSECPGKLVDTISL